MTRSIRRRACGPATFMLAYAVVTGVTCTRQSGCSVCSQFSAHSQIVAAPEEVVLIR